MDRSSIFGFILITVVLVIWIFLSTPQVSQDQKHIDTTSQVKKVQKDTIIPEVAKDTKINAIDSNYYGIWFKGKDIGTNGYLTIEGDRYIAKLSKKGGNIIEWQLKNFFYMEWISCTTDK